jgi:hypothetical protein
MSCILRISGASLDVVAMLAHRGLPADRAWNKGEARSIKAKVHIDCGAMVIASGAELDDIDRQMTEAGAFLASNVSAIAVMAATPSVQSAVLDFGVALTEGDLTRFCYFPPQFIRLVASCGIGLAVSSKVSRNTRRVPDMDVLHMNQARECLIRRERVRICAGLARLRKCRKAVSQ